MDDIYNALLIGIIAGTIDVIPMIIQKLNEAKSMLTYSGPGLIIPYVNRDMQPWLKGIVLALLTAAPIMIIVYPKDKKALIPMTTFSVILGTDAKYIS